MRAALGLSLVMLCSSAWAQEGRLGTTLRRATLVASCAASFWDLHTTARGAAYGARETNGLLADDKGRPRIGLMFAAKAGFCGFSVFAQEANLFGRKQAKYTTPLWTAMNVSSTVRFSVAAWRNLRVIDQLRAEQGATPAYLAPVP